MAILPILLELSPTEQIGLTIIGEARGEPIQGQVAVGCVIRNRFNLSLTKYKNYGDVIFEPLQFSCWNEHDLNYSLLSDLGSKLFEGQKVADIYLRQCMWVAQGIFDGSIMSNVGNRRFYMENSLYDYRRPKWAAESKTPLVIGKHTFFNI